MTAGGFVIGRSEGGGDASADGPFAGSGVGVVVSIGSGLSSGMPLLERVAFRFRTAMRLTRTAKRVKNTKNNIKGRHLQRAGPSRPGIGAPRPWRRPAKK